MTTQQVALIDEFRCSLGLGTQRDASADTLVLGLEGGRTLRLQAEEQGLLLLCSAALPPGDPVPWQMRALKACRLELGLPLALRAGRTRDGQLLLLARLGRHSQLAGLMQACALLRQQMQDILDGSINDGY